ncbi:MAG: putative ABC transporter, permease component [Desulfotomaculum sp. 46_296]|nr:MAG: putative ABC transporter, permease component [Desulfotomaculum sp. 46_296]
MITYSLSIALKKNGDPILMLVLAGIVIGSIFSSLISLTKYIADPNDTLPTITFWLMGSLTSIRIRDVLLLIIPVLLGTIPILIFRNKLNILAFGDEEAQSLGIDVHWVRLLFIICSTIITASSVSLCGMVGWVGLIIPHISRSLVGANHKVLIPASILTGSIFLMLVDDLSRTIFSVEVPLGIITSLIGAPFFIYLMFQKRRVWQ